MKNFIVAIMALIFLSTLFACSKKSSGPSITYTLSYHTNGLATGSSPDPTVQRSGTVIVLNTGTGLVRTGYIFGGWNTNVQGTGTTFSGGSNYTLAADITLYAIWNAVAGAQAKRISVENNGNTVIFELNTSSAAQSLYDQLPLTLPVENFGSNEKIFYPPQRLNTANTPISSGTAGGLAYYEPWGNVIMFYESYGALPTLGRAVQGIEHIRGISGTIQVKKIN